MNPGALPIKHAPALAEALFTTTQQRLLALLYGEPARSFYFKELLRKTGLGVATVKRELDRMVASGLLTRTARGNQHHYQANPACPIHDELAAIVRKTLGAPNAIREALRPLADRIARAFIFGSFAAGKDRPGSDIDLLVIGDVALAELARVLYPLQETLEREINPKLYRPAEWDRMVANEDAFARELLRKPRIALIGDAA
jgi:predicted nucleotidyltransferase